MNFIFDIKLKYVFKENLLSFLNQSLKNFGLSQEMIL
jgi:hypothetical protein